MLLYTIASAACVQTCAQQERRATRKQQTAAVQQLIATVNFIDNNYPQDLAADGKPKQEQAWVKDSNQQPIAIGFKPFHTYATKATDCYVDILALQNQPPQPTDRVAIPPQSAFVACSRHQQIFAAYIAQEFYNTVCEARDVLRRKPQEGEQLGYSMLQELQTFRQAAQQDPKLPEPHCDMMAALLQQIARSHSGVTQLLQN